MSTNKKDEKYEKDEKDEKDENFMIFNLDLDDLYLDVDDLDLQYTEEYTNQENICNNIKDCNISNDLEFALPQQMDRTKRKEYILSDYEKSNKNKKAKLHHC